KAPELLANLADRTSWQLRQGLISQAPHPCPGQAVVVGHQVLDVGHVLGIEKDSIAPGLGRIKKTVLDSQPVPVTAVPEKIETMVILFEQKDGLIGAGLIAQAPVRLMALGQKFQELMHIQPLALAGLTYPGVLHIWLGAAGGSGFQGP